MGLTRWLWVRHAPTDPAGRIIGHTDIPILPPDCDHLARTAARIASADVVFCSPLTRCRATLDLLRRQRPALPEATFHDVLMEQHFGDWEGKDHHATRAWDGLDLAAMADLRPPGGESFRDVVARMARFCAQNGPADAERTVAVIAHAGVIRAAVAHALDLPVHRGLSVAIAPLSVTALTDHGASGWAADYINRI
ncbi:MAG: histidine phosphatase family protein [Minwuia sp.]|nr:histidine phosphatase family protein [Minwuia sp.]